MAEQTPTAEQPDPVYEATLTMRSGAIVVGYVTKLETRTNVMGPGLAWIRWTDAPYGPRLHALDVAEIAAVVLRDLPAGESGGEHRG